MHSVSNTSFSVIKSLFAHSVNDDKSISEEDEGSIIIILLGLPESSARFHNETNEYIIYSLVKLH